MFRGDIFKNFKKLIKQKNIDCNTKIIIVIQLVTADCRVTEKNTAHKNQHSTCRLIQKDQNNRLFP